MTTLAEVADSILAMTVARAGGVPGVVAQATSRDDTLYSGTAGVREAGADQPMTVDSVMLLASCTKAITGVAVMQLVEEGALSLDDAARDYVPEIAEIPVFEGFDDSGKARLRPARGDITLNQLMLHTAGFGYEFLSEDLLRYRTEQEIPSILACQVEAIRDVLLFDPGEQWAYGTNIDWLGRIVETVRGKLLGEVFAERIFAPLGMTDTAFVMTPSMRERLATVHQRMPDGQLVAQPDLVLPQESIMHMGGHGLYGTVPDYLRFIRMFLNDGDGPNGRVLAADTVARMAANGLGELKVGAFPTSIPAMMNPGEMFPGVSKSWAYTFLVNDEAAPTGRPAGALAWAGIANSYYWIDRVNGLGGMWSSQVLPFMDIASWPGYLDFEAAVYRYAG